MGQAASRSLASFSSEPEPSRQPIKSTLELSNRVGGVRESGTRVTSKTRWLTRQKRPGHPVARTSSMSAAEPQSRDTLLECINFDSRGISKLLHLAVYHSTHCVKVAEILA
jgi:hypothetical protein